MMGVLLSCVVASASYAEDCTLTHGAASGGNTPFTMKVTGGAAANNYQVVIRKVLGYSSAGPMLGPPTAVVLNAQFADIPGGGQTYTGHSKVHNLQTGSGAYKFNFEKSNVTPIVTLAIMEGNP
jgi:hypothetical protein